MVRKYSARDALNWPNANFIGFDTLFRDLEHVINNGVDLQAFPRHNLIKIDDTQFSIELALAGYSREDISIELKDGKMLITGTVDDDEREFIHKGISTKAFRKEFRLNEDTVVGDADFVDGILKVSLTKVVPEEKKPVLVKIN